ncbi:hypothetical protein [Sphingomonas sp.]|uniref:hypothetical protein n=1 Tax=Sphingomonas sp. TaxID=28214 RepID=UPI0025FECB4B|nr:hypothetical protein [Sphingomonas sp.]
MRILAMMLACCLASTLAHSPALAADVPDVVGAKDRAIASGHPAQVIVGQRQIESTIDIGRVASSDSGGGGILGSIIIAGMDDKKQVLSQSARAQAEAEIAPLRQALNGFDIDALALATTEAALAKSSWLHPNKISLASSGASADTAPTSALVIYRYETSPDFTQVRVVADVRLVSPPAKKGAPSPAPIYRELITSVVLLRSPSLDASENVARWSADDGKLAKAALTNAFASLEQLIPFTLDISEADAKAIAAKGRAKAFAAGYYGPSIQQGGAKPGETLIWAKGFVNVQPSPAL